MLLCLLLLLVCSAQASHFYGTVMTYYPNNMNSPGSFTVVLRYKLTFHECTQNDLWRCFSGDNCGTEDSLELNIVMDNGDWCQREGIMTRTVSTSAPFQLQLDGGNWINNIRNGIINWRAVTLVDLRIRSDIDQANTSPQTTIIPVVRVPSNCERDFNLLAFDPDGDSVECRYGDAAQSECNPCTLPSVLSLSPTSCTLSFSPTDSTNEGPYAVQLVMEDFPRESIHLNRSDGVEPTITTRFAMSKLPVQFVLRVDPAVPSCTEGLYLPRFLSPTPATRAQLFTPANQALEISINAEANNSMISKLLFSGPHNMISDSLGAGQYTLRWTPSEAEDGESHPICFIVQAELNSDKYDSELRCIIVSVGNDSSVTTTSQPTTTAVATTNITTPQPTTTAPPTTTNITTPQPTTTAPPTTTNITTPQPTTTAPPTTTTNITTPQPTTTAPPTTTNITTPQPTTTAPPTTTTNITTPQPTTTAPPTTTTPTTTTITTPQPTTTAPPTTTPPPTTTITTPQPTTTLPPTTTPPPTTTITTPQPTTTAPPTTTTPTTTNITTPQPTTTLPPTTTPPPTTTITTPQPTTTAPPTTTLPTTTTITTPQPTTTLPPTTTPPPTTTITTPQPTTTTPPTTTLPTTTTITTPQPTTTAPPTTTTPTTTTITTPQPTTTAPPTTTTPTTTTITTPQPTTTAPPTTTTPTTTTITTPQSTTTALPTTTTASPPSVTTPDVSNINVVALRMRLSSSIPLSEDFIRSTIIQQIKDELVRQGLPSDTTVNLVSSTQV